MWISYLYVEIKQQAKQWHQSSPLKLKNSSRLKQISWELCSVRQKGCAFGRFHGAGTTMTLQEY